jgi:CRP-like cAMP-binding protein
VPLSKDPAARRKQLANLKTTSAVKHGTRSEALIRPLAEMYLAELTGEFPQASERVLRLQARRLAKLDRLASYLEGRGEIRHQRRGDVFPASAMEEQITASFLATQGRLEVQARETNGKPAAGLEQLRQRGAQIISDQGGEHVGS